MLIKVEIPSGSNIFKPRKICFLVNNSHELTRQVVMDALENKAIALSNDESNRHLMNNYIACFNVMKKYTNEENWVYLGDKENRVLPLDSDYSLVIRFHRMDVVDLTDK